MTVSYKHMRCPGCDGTLRYIKEKKIWECIYCGNEISREENADGLYSLKNLVKLVLENLAYERIEEARAGLTECRKVNPDYIGTVIAGICLNVFSLTVPGTVKAGEVNGIIAQVKRLYARLSGGSGEIPDEEEALYEILAEDADALGVLILVYDTLQAVPHLAFVLKFFDASLVYSQMLNRKLLLYALKNGKDAMVEKIIANTDNIDCRDAFLQCLEKQKDSGIKREYLPRLMERAEFQSEDYRFMDAYLEHTGDCAATKVSLYRSFAGCGLAPSLQNVISHILNDPEMTEDMVRETISAFCGTKPKDAELYDLITDIYTGHLGGLAVAEMEEIAGSGIFVKMSDKTVRKMLARQNLPIKERLALLDLAEQCRLTPKENDAIFAGILTGAEESFENRSLLVKKMTEYVRTVSPSTFASYFLSSTIDGERKPEILEALLALDFNTGSLRNLLTDYLKNGRDTDAVKKAVIKLFAARGISVEAALLLEAALAATKENLPEVAAFIGNAVENDTEIGQDILSRYLEGVSPKCCSQEIIALFSTPASAVTDKALAAYVLYAAVPPKEKLPTAFVLAEKNGKAFGESMCEIRHLGCTVKCNLFQAYVLLATDEEETASAITEMMNQAEVRLSPPMLVDGRSIKFKRYALDNKARLSALSLQLCNANNVFSLLF